MNVSANYPFDGNTGDENIYSKTPDDSSFVDLALTYSVNHESMSKR